MPQHFGRGDRRVPWCFPWPDRSAALEKKFEATRARIREIEERVTERIEEDAAGEPDRE